MGKKSLGYPTIAYSEKDAQRIVETFGHLSRHITTFLITGGVVSAYYFWKNHYPLEVRKLGDLDVIITDPSDLKPSVTADFLISHYHPKNKKGKFHIILIDKQTSVRIDIFPLRSKADQRTQKIVLAGHSYPILAPEDLTCRLLSTCEDILNEKTIDAKYLVKMIALLGCCDRSQIETVWVEYTQENTTFAETYLAVTTKAQTNPQLLMPYIHDPKFNIRCEKCQDVPEFPFASEEEIYKLLGWESNHSLG